MVVLNKGDSEVELMDRLLKEVTRPTKAVTSLLDERKQRLKASINQLESVQATVQSDGSDLVGKIAESCEPDNVQLIENRLSNCLENLEKILNTAKNEFDQLKAKMKNLEDFEERTNQMANEIQNSDSARLESLRQVFKQTRRLLSLSFDWSSVILITLIRSELDDFKEETNEMLSRWKFSDTTPIQNRFQELENQLKDALERESERKRDAEREKMLEKQRIEDLLDIEKSIGRF